MVSSDKKKPKNWGAFLQNILPDDPTGELQKLSDFVANNFDIMKWMALTVLIVQVKNFHKNIMP